jgi:hypothetical protein
MSYFTDFVVIVITKREDVSHSLSLLTTRISIWYLYSISSLFKPLINSLPHFVHLAVIERLINKDEKIPSPPPPRCRQLLRLKRFLRAKVFRRERTGLHSRKYC